MDQKGYNIHSNTLKIKMKGSKGFKKYTTEGKIIFTKKLLKQENK